MKALITGITGQDGGYLAEFLLSKGYEVHGVVRRLPVSHEKPRHLEGVELHYGEMTDSCSLEKVFNDVQPDELYNLAAQSHVHVSFDLPVATANIVGLGSLRLLEIIRRSGSKCKFYQAGSSEMFGGLPETSPQNERTKFQPRSPYAIAKVAAHHAVLNYRESYGIFASNGILFNHESPRRGETFVTRKITKAVSRIKKGLQNKLELGNLKAFRDWGFSGDYVKGMWLMLQHEKPGDYVLATGETHSVQEFCEEAFGYAGLDWRDYVVVSEQFKRPSEVPLLLGDSSKARNVLGWKPEVGFQELVRIMVESDMKE